MDTIIDSIQDVNYNGYFYSKEEIIKLAIYQCLFTPIFLLYITLETICIILYLKDLNVVVFRVVVTSLLLLFILFVILFISLRHALKESLFGTIIAFVLINIPFCRFACSVASLIQAKRIFSLAALDHFDNLSFIDFLECLLKENKYKTPKIIWRFTKRYVIFLLLCLIPVTGYNTTEYLLEKNENSKTPNKATSSKEFYSHERNRNGTPTNRSNDASFFDKDKLFQISLLVGLALLKDALEPQSQQINISTSGSSSMPKTCLSCGGTGFHSHGLLNEHCYACGGTGYERH